ncbi:unnamed protein product [Linum trigynum]|uniref:Uncharacterized protein n=1 Tax=Linum trigynum TaxID=586398 RepID=A0AAV2FC70_9ROSI
MGADTRSCDISPCPNFSLSSSSHQGNLNRHRLLNPSPPSSNIIYHLVIWEIKSHRRRPRHGCRWYEKGRIKRGTKLGRAGDQAPQHARPRCGSSRRSLFRRLLWSSQIWENRRFAPGISYSATERNSRIVVARI